MTDRKFKGIQKITVNSVDETNIMDVDIWAVTDDLSEDLIEILFMAGVIEGVGDKQWAKCMLIKIVHDGWTDVWDLYISDDTVGTPIPTFSITFDTLTAGVAGTEVWSWDAGIHVSNRDEIGVKIEEKRTPGAIYVLALGAVVITHP